MVKSALFLMAIAKGVANAISLVCEKSVGWKGWSSAALVKRHIGGSRVEWALK
jgi:hypothetical protein